MVAFQTLKNTPTNVRVLSVDYSKTKTIKQTLVAKWSVKLGIGWCIEENLLDVPEAVWQTYSGHFAATVKCYFVASLRES